jgi:hypothetical protein
MDSVYRPNPSKPLFRGMVDGDFFEVRRTNRSFVIFRGRIMPRPAGSAINVTAVLQPYASAFSVIWFGAVGCVTVFSLFAPRTPYADPIAGIIGGSNLFLFGVAFLCFNFFPDAIKARRLLEKSLVEDGV